MQVRKVLAIDFAAFLTKILRQLPLLFSLQVGSEALPSGSKRDLTLGIIVIGTGLLGWLLNIVLVLCSGPLYGIDDAQPFRER
jgi:hypothetical protein